MSQPENPAPKSATSQLHAMNLIVALLAGVISITGGIYSLKNNLFSGPAYGSLQGIVRDERIARPLKLVSVEVSDLTGAVVNTAATDDDGHYMIESLKIGNYVVKFTAPLHKVESKTIKIEKDLASSINVDLVPEKELAKTFPAVTEVAGPISASTADPAALPQNTPPAVQTYGATPYSGAGNSLPPQPVSGYQQPYSQTQDASASGPSGYRRHSRRNYYGATSGMNDSNMAQTGAAQNQNSAIAQVGTQLLQAWLDKKSESNSSTTSSTTSN